MPITEASVLEAQVREPEEVEVLQAVGAQCRLVMAGSDTDGTWCLMDYTAPPGFAGPPLHFHRNTAEMFYVLEGELTMQVGSELKTLRPGGVAIVPPETLHKFFNRSDKPARFLGQASPSGIDELIREQMEMARREGQWPLKDMRPVRELQRRYDSYPPEELR